MELHFWGQPQFSLSFWAFLLLSLLWITELMHF